MAHRTDDKPSPQTVTPEPPPGRHSVLARLGVVLLSVLLGLAAAEVLLRAYVSVQASKKTATAEAGILQQLPDSARRYALRPGLASPVNTNAQGFRGEPVDVAKPAGVRRIVMLGDSITYGNSVAWNETFSYVLQQKLNERAGGTAFEVLNLGVSGYNTAQELATLRDVGLSFSPDLIILNVCLNDSDPIKTMSAIGLRNEVGLRDSGDINLRTIVETSYLLTMLKYALGAAFEQHPAVLRLLNSPEAFINVRTGEKRWDDMKQNMQEIFAVAREEQIPIAMVIYPYSSQVGLPEARLVPQQDLLAFAAANGIPALDASPAYANQPQDMFADGFIHLSPYGHRVIAAAMADFLAGRGLVPES